MNSPHQVRWQRSGDEAIKPGEAGVAEVGEEKVSGTFFSWVRQGVEMIFCIDKVCDLSAVVYALTVEERSDGNQGG